MNFFKRFILRKKEILRKRENRLDKLVKSPLIKNMRYIIYQDSTMCVPQELVDQFVHDIKEYSDEEIKEASLLLKNMYDKIQKQNDVVDGDLYKYVSCLCIWFANEINQGREPPTCLLN